MLSLLLLLLFTGLGENFLSAEYNLAAKNLSPEIWSLVWNFFRRLLRFFSPKLLNSLETAVQLIASLTVWQLSLLNPFSTHGGGLANFWRNPLGAKIWPDFKVRLLPAKKFAKLTTGWIFLHNNINQLRQLSVAKAIPILLDVGVLKVNHFSRKFYDMVY